MQPIDVVALVLVLAAGIGCINALLVGLPRSIGMLVGSLLLALAAITIDRVAGIHLVRWYDASIDGADLPHVFLDGALAMLLFAGSLHVDARALTGRKFLILALATATVVIATVVFGAGLFAAFRLSGIAVPLAWCVLAGAILAPTDAVVVDSLLRRAALPERLRAAITGESLFNDGAALVLYLAVLGITQGQTGLIGHGRFLFALTVAVAGGAAIGGAGGAVGAWLIQRITDAGLQLMVSLALVLACYRLAVAAEVSAPIAVVSAGLALKLLTPGFAPGAGHNGGRYATLAGFWALLDELLDTLLFLLIGLQVMALSFRGLLLPALLAVPVGLLARLVSVAIPVGLAPGAARDKLRETAVLTWAGLRGGISVALALTLPPTPYRAHLLGICYTGVLFSIVVQGLSMGRVLRALYGTSSTAGAG